MKNSFKNSLVSLSDEDLLKKAIELIIGDLSGISVKSSRLKDVYDECSSRDGLIYDKAYEIAREELAGISDSESCQIVDDYGNSQEINELADNLSLLMKDRIFAESNKNRSIYNPEKAGLDLNKMLLIKVNGDSMVDAGIFDADELVVDAESEIRNGDLVIVRINGKVFVKRYILESTNIIFRSENKKYPDFIIDEKHNWKIEGLVLYKKLK